MNSHHPKVLKWGNGGQLMSIKSPSLTTFEPPVDDGLMISSPSLRDSIGTHGKQVATGSFGGILCATVVTYFWNILIHSETFWPVLVLNLPGLAYRVPSPRWAMRQAFDQARSYSPEEPEPRSGSWMQLAHVGTIKGRACYDCYDWLAQRTLSIFVLSETFTCPLFATLGCWINAASSLYLQLQVWKRAGKDWHSKISGQLHSVQCRPPQVGFSQISN